MSELTQEARKPLRGRMFRRDSARPREKRILLLKTGVAGLVLGDRIIEEKVTVGMELTLYREPKNKVDEWAISVYLPDGSRAGFVTRFKNEPLARLMDAGKKLIGVVDDPKEYAEKEAEDGESERNRRAPTENMRLPFSVYLIEESY